MDIDEYFVPIVNTTWGPLLEGKGIDSPVLGLRESRARPRFEMMEQVTDRHKCSRTTEIDDVKNSASEEPRCLVPRSNETFLSIYNCDSVKPPRPRGYFTNMKQIYRPDFVVSHFVHYSVITRKIAEYYKDKKNPSAYSRKPLPEEK